jgi:hypothetical protein
MIPTVRLPLIIEIIRGLCIVFIVIPVLLVYLLCIYVLTMILVFFTLPWTLYYYTANWGLTGKDKKTLQGYVDIVESRHLVVRSLVQKYKPDPNRRKPRKLSHYPLKTDHFFCCIPMIGWMYSAEYKFSIYVVFLSLLEGEGWNRKTVYSLLRRTIEETGTTVGEDFDIVEKKLFRGDILTSIDSFLNQPGTILLNYCIYKSPKMWNCASAIDIDRDQADWILNEGAVVRPRDVCILRSLDTLNTELGGDIWKFASSADDV